MKKLLLFLAVMAIILMAGCSTVDQVCTWYYKIDNQINTDIVVEVGNGETIYQSRLIESHYKQTIYDEKGDCGKDEFLKNRPEEPIIYSVDYMKIDGEIVSNDILKSKYWDLFIDNKYTFICTLTLTPELLEEMRQQEEL